MLVPVFLFCQALYLGSEARVHIPLSEFNTRIVGGDFIEITEAPYQVSIQSEGYHYCGGTLVAKDTIITAAHCLIETELEEIEVRVGSTSNKNGGKVYLVRKTLSHPDFNIADVDSDIAILWLSEPVELSDKVATISMKNSDEEIDDDDAVLVSGWGDTVPKYSYVKSPTNLKRVELKKVNQETCFNAYQELGMDITKNMVCAGVPEGGLGPCHRDSGGPLVHDGKLAGVVSFGYGCAREGYPSVFAKVSALRSWVDENMNKEQ